MLLDFVSNNKIYFYFKTINSFLQCKYFPKILMQLFMKISILINIHLLQKIVYFFYLNNRILIEPSNYNLRQFVLYILKVESLEKN